MYCNTDWATETDILYDEDGNEVKRTDENGNEVNVNIHEKGAYPDKPGLSMKWM